VTKRCRIEAHKISSHAQVGALSLNGRIFTCLVLDEEVTPGARDLGKHFIDELMDLADRTGLNVKKEDILG
jgi:hypothetical protein